MKLPDSALKWFPVLLVIAIIVFITGDRLRQQAQEAPQSTGMNSFDLGEDEHSHSHDGEADPHDDPEKNRLMGNFHNNEGIKAASQEKWEEAIRNFKMALHHTKVGSENLDLLRTSPDVLGGPGASKRNESQITKGLLKTLEKALVNMSTSYLKLGNYDEALKTLKELEAVSPDHPLLHYNLSCYHSLRKDIPASLQELKKTVELGYRDFTSLLSDPDLNNLRQDESFKQWWQTLEQK